MSDYYKNYLAKIERFGFDARIEVEDGDVTSLIFRASKGQQRLHDIALGYRRAEMVIRSDTLLTAEGHAAKIKEAAKKSLAELDEAEKMFLEPISSRLLVLRKEFSIEAKSTDNVSETMREIEIRGMLQKLDKLALTRIFEEAIETLDAITFRAFVNVPKFAYLLNEKTIAQGKRMWAERQNPAVAKELILLEDAYSILISQYGEIRAGIGSIGQITDDSMRARLQRLAQTAIDDSERVRKAPHRLAQEPTDLQGNNMPANDRVLNIGK